MKLIIAGSRTFTDTAVLDEAMKKFMVVRAMPFVRKSTDMRLISLEVVSGGAQGVDAMAEDWAKRHAYLGVTLKIFPADWDKWGKSAGPRRNLQMGEYADELLALWDGESRGTKNMVDTMKHLGKPVIIKRI